MSAEGDMMGLGEIRARLEAATPGPWRLVTAIDTWGDGDLDELTDPVVESETATLARNGEPLYVCQLSYDGLSATVAHDRKADGEFIAHSRADIEKLLAVAEAARAYLAARWDDSDRSGGEQESVAVDTLYAALDAIGRKG
jgi:hypothetical protein